MRIITKIAIHNFGGLASNPLASTKNLTLDQINKAHKARDFNLSELGYYVGYNVVVFPDGSYKQTRKIGEETCAATGSNFDTLHICLAGNFTKGSPDIPTDSQKRTLKMLINSVLINRENTKLVWKEATENNMSVSRIYPHRFVQPNHTECYGSSLSDDWARMLVLVDEDQYKLSLMKQIQVLWFQIQDIRNKRKIGRAVLGATDDKNYCGLLDI